MDVSFNDLTLVGQFPSLAVFECRLVLVEFEEFRRHRETELQAFNRWLHPPERNLDVAWLVLVSRIGS